MPRVRLVVNWAESAIVSISQDILICISLVIDTFLLLTPPILAAIISQSEACTDSH